MIYLDDKRLSDRRIKLTRSELNTLRKHAQKNGCSIGEIHTESEYLKSLIKGLSAERAKDMLEFMEKRNFLDMGS